jgi:uncharacterized membrane protein
MRVLHIVAGLLAIGSGAVALYALKGGPLHRKSGMIFAYAMLFMSASGAVMAALKPQRISVVAGMLTFYLVITALLTVRRREAGWQRLDVAVMLVAVLVGVASVRFSLQALGSPSGKLEGLSAAPGFMFAAVALVATLGDIRMMRAGGLQGAPRIARHLWRMCFALYIAVASFFLGQAQVFPQAIRRSGLLPVPVLLVIGIMLFWLYRVRFTSRYRQAPGLSAIRGSS